MIKQLASKIAALGLVGLVGLAVWAGVLAPLLAALEAEREQLSIASERLARVEAAARTRDKLAQADGLDERRLYEPLFALPERNSLAHAQLQKAAQDAARKHDIRLRRNVVLTPARDGQLEWLRLSLSYSGRFENVTGFLADLRAQNILLAIPNWSLARDGRTDGPIQVSGTLELHAARIIKGDGNEA